MQLEHENQRLRQDLHQRPSGQQDYLDPKLVEVRATEGRGARGIEGAGGEGGGTGRPGRRRRYGATGEEEEEEGDDDQLNL
jgi:hypothetical protein